MAGYPAKDVVPGTSDKRFYTRRNTGRLGLKSDVYRIYDLRYLIRSVSCILDNIRLDIILNLISERVPDVQSGVSGLRYLENYIFG